MIRSIIKFLLIISSLSKVTFSLILANNKVKSNSIQSLTCSKLDEVEINSDDSLLYPPTQRNTRSTTTTRVPSFIDFNADKSFEGDMNAGLGTERLIYEDSDMMVFDKPSLAQTAPGFATKDSLATRVQQQYGIERIDHMIVHRLDYATSGIVIFAKNIDSLRSLHTQFRQHHKLYKRYVAIVHGTFDCLEGEIHLPLGRDEVRGPPLQCVIHPEKGGKESLTYYTVEGMKNNTSLVHLIPKTGRTHQLRCHLATLEHPILGDLFYASKEIYYQSRRLLLHAEEIRIFHPRLRYPMRFYAPCPFNLDNI